MTYLTITVLLIGILQSGSSIPLGIINGSDVHENLPFMVSIRYDSHFLGSGVLISKNWMVTVGHLFTEFSKAELKKLTIGYGSNELDKQKVGQVSKVVEDLFNATTRLNDIALVKLAKDVELDFKIEIDKLNPAGAKIAGWGNVKHKDERTPNHLKWIMLTHVKLSECKAKLLPEYTKGKISPKSNFCLSNKSSSACYGDSGSPAFQFEKNHLKLYGLVSWGDKSCTKGSPIVFTDLYHYRELIHNTTSCNL